MLFVNKKVLESARKRQLVWPIARNHAQKAPSSPPAFSLPNYLQAPNGEVVEYPHGRLSPLSGTVSYVGVNAVRRLLPEWDIRSKLVNRARLIYLDIYRDNLMKTCHGMWVAVGSDRRVVVCDCGEAVRKARASS